MGGLPTPEAARAMRSAADEIERARPLPVGMSTESLKRVLAIAAPQMAPDRAEALASRAMTAAETLAMEILASGMRA